MLVWAFTLSGVLTSAATVSVFPQNGVMVATSLTGKPEVIQLANGEIANAASFAPETASLLYKIYTDWRQAQGVLPDVAEQFWQKQKIKESTATKPSESADVIASQGAVWGKTRSGYQPIPVVNGKVTVDSRFLPSVAGALRDHYAQAQTRGKLSPLAEQYLREFNTNHATQVSQMTPSPQQKPAFHAVAAKVRAVAAGPQTQRTNPLGLVYMNPLPYPELYKQCEEAHLNNQCIDGRHYALWGEMDHTVCTGKTFSVLGHTPCEARARFQFEKCIALEKESETPTCTSVVAGEEPNARSKQIRQCRAELINENCRDGIALDPMQCVVSVAQNPGGKPLALRSTNADSCVSASRLGFEACVLSRTPLNVVGKEIECRRLAKQDEPFKVKIASAKDLGTTSSGWGREYIFFHDQKDLNRNDYARFESCLVTLFGRANVISFPYGNPSFVLISNWGNLGVPSLEYLHRKADSNQDCNYLRSKRPNWDATFKAHQMGPWGVAHEDYSVIGSDPFR